jgi:hypothetical protein
MDEPAPRDDDVMKLVMAIKAIGGALGKKDKGLEMIESDAVCYSSRYSDLDGKPAREHYKLIGAEQGRLPHCARDLTDYEALTYLHNFPEL